MSLWIHGWDKQTYRTPATVELDWTKFFDWETRRIASQEDWDKELFPQLKSTKETSNRLPDGRFIDIRGKLPLTASLAVGFMFPIVAGYRFRVEQPTETGTSCGIRTRSIHPSGHSKLLKSEILPKVLTFLLHFQ